MNNLANIRKKKGFTQQFLADKCGMKREQIARIESKKSNPRVSTAKIICKALDVELNELFASN